MQKTFTGAISAPKRLSHSACEVLDSCELQYLFQQRMKLDAEPRLQDYAASGKIVHDVIPASNDLISIEDCLQCEDPYNLILSKVDAAMQANEVKPKYQKEEEITLECLNNYVNFMEQRFNHLADRGLLRRFLPVQQETWLNAKLTSKKIPFTGRLDSVFKDYRTWLVDWKTSSNTSIGETEIRQAIRYLLMYKLRYPAISPEFDPCDFYVINLRKPVNLSKCRVPITQKMIDSEISHLEELWERANGNQFRKQKAYGTCIFCDYKLRCASSPSVVDLLSSVDSWI